MAKYNMVTKCGIEPDTSEVKYRIETRQVEAVLQKMLTAKEQILRKEGKYDGPPLKLRVASASIGSKDAFRSLILILEKTALVPDKRAKRSSNPNNDHTLSVFNKDYRSTRDAAVHPGIMDLFRPMFYDADYVKGFASASARRGNGNITITDAQSFQRIAAKPKISRFQGEKFESVLVALDPMKVFYHMLAWDPETNPDAGKQYELWIVEDQITNLNNPYNCRYTVYRNIKKPNSKKRGSNDFTALVGMRRGNPNNNN